MGAVHFCDACSKRLKGYQNEITVRSFHRQVDSKEYCFDCWCNPASWPVIHQVKPIAKRHKTV